MTKSFGKGRRQNGAKKQETETTLLRFSKYAYVMTEVEPMTIVWMKTLWRGSFHGECLHRGFKDI
ncbi:hypothetical protein [Bacillus sp. RO1]|uniref:hypothetical protein n=1 Tax=Bacillus sp. RO1 TaxID=2722703 RepID=UPI0014563046|nr:hypothetical protein [Bacillus sp. RO1]NLP52345.1 hypothetical protein [Bacillus sp. RO1]